MSRRFPAAIATAFAAALLIPSAAPALEVRAHAIPNGGVFGVELAGTDAQFYARADRVISVSWQEYTTGAYIVSEVVVDLADSNQQIRLYSLRPPGATEAAEIADRAVSSSPLPKGLAPGGRALPSPVRRVEEGVSGGLSSAAATMPVKSYPVTTHARTVEYVVGSRDELLRFYSAIRDLYCGKEVPATPGAGTAFGTPASGASSATVNRLGGTVFILKP